MVRGTERGVSGLAYASAFLFLLVGLTNASFAHAQTSANSCAPISHTLSVASHGAEVTSLQSVLVDQKLLNASSVTGYFGPATKAAVTAFQKAHGLEAVGFVGPRTVAAINALCNGAPASTPAPISTIVSPPTSISDLAITRTLALGANGADVSLLQQLLKVAGYYTYPQITGHFGPATKAAVTAFQKAHGLEAVGFVGPRTRIALTGISGHGSAGQGGGSGSNGPISQPPTPTLTVDNVSVGSPAQTSVTITWNTNLPADSSVEYGVTSAYGSASSSSALGTTHSITLTGLSAGTTYHFRVRSASVTFTTYSDDATFTTASAGGDVTPPVLSSISSGVPGQTTATITWTTDENANSRVDFGTSASYGTASTSSSLVTSHSITLTGLSASTLYHFRVQSADASSNTATSSDQTFTTSAVPDVNPPLVAITVPTAGATVSGSSVTLTASSTDDVAVAGVTFKVNGSTIGSEDSTFPYSVSWDSTATSSGSKSVVAVARDTSNNYATSSAISFTVDNAAPVISSLATSSVTHVSATITWTTDENANTRVDYGTTGSYGSASTSASFVTSHSITLTGLTPSTLYHFRAQSADGQGNTATSSDQTFTTSAAPDVTPPVISSVASTTSYATATVTWTTDEVSNSKVSYGTVSGTYTTSTSSSSLVTSHSLGLTGLSASTRYYFVVVSTDGSGNTATSSETSLLTTAAPDVTPPVISSIASTTSYSTSTVTWTTDEVSNSKVSYGTSSGVYTTSTSSASLVTSHSIGVTSLSASTRYYFVVVSSDASGNTATSSESSFTTTAAPDVTPPVISSVASTTSYATATVTWTTDEVSNSKVSYGTSAGVYTTSTSSAALVTSHSLGLTGLSASTRYYFVVVSTDGSGNTATSSESSLLTTAAPDVTPPVISAVASSTSYSTATVTWTTDEASNSKVSYGTSAGVYTTSTSSASLVTSHSLGLTGLSASTRYYFVVVSTDGSGNTATSSESSLLTTAAPDVTPPVISAVASSTSSTAATVTWTTDESSDSKVAYGTSAGTYTTSTSSSSLVTSHSLGLTGLSASTRYYFVVVSTDGSGNTATSSESSLLTTSGAVADGTVTGASIQSNGYLADITVAGLSSGGTYSLTPNNTPKLTFNVTTTGYNSSGNSISVSRSVYGTIPFRNAYPNGATTTESAAGGTLTSTVVLSDDILPGDTVTLTGLSSWYTKSTSTAAVSGLSVTNNSAATEYRPIGAWITPTNLRRASTTGFTAEFTVSDRYPRNNGQVAAVKFIATDGSASVTHVVSSMSQSAFLASTTCSVTSGSAVLSSCGDTSNFLAGEYITVSTGSASAVATGSPRLASVDSSSQMTMNVNANTTSSVTVTVGNPVYVYSTTFTPTELNTLAQGTTTVRAIAYPNVGSITLDTSTGGNGVAISAATTSPNLKSLQFLNDKNDSYIPIYAWASTTAGASPAVQTTATDPGSTAYYGSIKAAADALKTYYNANKGHNNSCGGVIYVKAGTTTGFGGDIGTAGDSPRDCATYLTIQAEPGHTATDTEITAGGSTVRGAGYTTLIKNLKITDNATNKIAIAGPDGASTAARQAHNVFQNSWILETQSSPSAFMNQIGWREFYNSIVDQTIGDGSILKAFSTTGVASTELGSTLLGSSNAQVFTTIGNVSSNVRYTESGTSTANYLVPTSAFMGFNKFMSVNNANVVTMSNDSMLKDNYAMVQNVFEQTGTTQNSPVVAFAADDDVGNINNFLREYDTNVGSRTNLMYDSLGQTVAPKLAHELFTFDQERYSKSDYFLNPADRYVTTITVTAGGSGYTSATVSVAAPSGTNGVTALAHANLSGGAVSTITLDTTICGNTGGQGYSAAPTVTITGNGTGATATASISASGTGQPCAVRTQNWRWRFGVGDIGNVTGLQAANNNNPPAYDAWIGDFLGLAGNTTNAGDNLSSFTWQAANQNSTSGSAGNNTGFGWYKPNSTTGLTNRVPSGYAGFPGDIEGTPRKNDGTGCAGAYEC